MRITGDKRYVRTRCLDAASWDLWNIGRSAEEGGYKLSISASLHLGDSLIGDEPRYPVFVLPTGGLDRI